jgi:hypothetical protein
VTCIAHLPKLFDLTVQESKVLVATQKAIDNTVLRVTDSSGATVAEGHLSKGSCELTIPAPSRQGRLICKLYRNRYVIDATGFVIRGETAEKSDP